MTLEIKEQTRAVQQEIEALNKRMDFNETKNQQDIRYCMDRL